MCSHWACSAALRSAPLCPLALQAGGILTAVLGLLMCPWNLVSSTHGFVNTWLIGGSGQTHWGDVGNDGQAGQSHGAAWSRRKVVRLCAGSCAAKRLNCAKHCHPTPRHGLHHSSLPRPTAYQCPPTPLPGYSALLGPVIGIVMSDYFIVRQRQLDIDSLYSKGDKSIYWYKVRVLKSTRKTKRKDSVCDATT